MKKPIIILSPQQMPMEEPYKGKYSYSNSFNSSALLAAGALPLIPPYLNEDSALELMDIAQGLFLTGGGDICPSLYGEEALPECEEMDSARDSSDWALLRAALKLSKPVLCVCRGMQLSNVYFGGSLYQHLPAQHKTEIDHSQWSFPEYEQSSAHSVDICPGTPLYKLLGESSINVNSLHHQAVKELGSGLVPMAYSPDGIVESFYLPSDTQWLWAYQWHPEMLKDNKYADLIFKDFISACNK